MSDVENTRKERAQLLVEFQDQILAVEDELDIAFEEYREHFHRVPDQDLVISAVESVLAGSIDEERIEDVVYPVLNFILNHGVEEVQTLRAQDPRQEFLNFMSRLGVKYQAFVYDIRNRWLQGPHSWRDMETSFVRRENNQPGIDYKIYVGDQDEVDLSVSLRSNLQLVRYLLNQENRAIEHFPEEAEERIHSEEIERIEVALSTMKEQLSLEQ